MNKLEKITIWLNYVAIIFGIAALMIFYFTSGFYQLPFTIIWFGFIVFSLIYIGWFIYKSTTREPKIVYEFSGDIDPEFINKLASMIDLMEKGEDNQIGFDNFVRESINKFQRVPTVVEFASACTIWAMRSK